MADELKSCPLCKLKVPQLPMVKIDIRRYDCPRCGRFEVDGSLEAQLVGGDFKPDERREFPYLPAHTRQEWELGRVVTLPFNWMELARPHRERPVLRKAHSLLEVIARRSTHPGSQVQLDAQTDYPLVDAASAEEFDFLLDFVAEAGDVGVNEPRTFGQDRTHFVSVRGWEKLQAETSSGVPGRCFVAMSFDPSLNDAWENGLRKGVAACGLDPIRIDKVHHNEKICDKILVELRRAQFVVADVTMQRQGVYFEAGFAAGLGRPVIWCCRKDDLSNTHFDTRQYNHIVWETPEDLRIQLEDRIRATILR